MSFQVLMAASMKMAVFWDVTPCSLYKFTDVLEVLDAAIRPLSAVSTFETSVSLFRAARRSIPEDSHLHTRLICCVQ
jgi:hypothetical protein